MKRFFLMLSISMLCFSCSNDLVDSLDDIAPNTQGAVAGNTTDGPVDSWIPLTPGVNTPSTDAAGPVDSWIPLTPGVNTPSTDAAGPVDSWIPLTPGVNTPSTDAAGPVDSWIPLTPGVK
ncbi:hypothetical protein K5X82_08945 [Halosquirtibacter xylanolyticus]|uniref:hypothetical protein n=1 Tax=Halosquirtibacter xylanolyticus TaxID=3374599 RepID=UPI003749A03A|nr:hypothetical protein K5X82_08945 [Prolixibacteraceae bacterium]